jgi:hypothetical protein
MIKIFRVVLYGHRTLSLTLKEEHEFKVSENRDLRIILGRLLEEVIGWGKLYNE